MSKGWTEVGRIARLRRERLGLKQEDLQQFGGPKVTTVGKFERAAAQFPLRTQHQMEKALGWSRGTVEDLVGAADEDDWESMWRGDYEERLIRMDVPDMSQTSVRPASRAGDLTDDELLAELTYRMKRYALVETTKGGDGNGSTASNRPADSELSAAPDELPAAAKEGLIEEAGEFNT